MKYLLDANVFIQAHRTFLNSEIAPGFWDWLETQNKLGTVFSIDAVREELKGGQNGLAQWATENKEIFLPPDQPVVDSLREVVAWADANPQYSGSAVATFADNADSFLVAHARAHGLVAVTMETTSKRQNIVKIPDACEALGVEYVTPLSMLRQEGLRLVAS